MLIFYLLLSWKLDTGNHLFVDNGIYVPSNRVWIALHIYLFFYSSKLVQLFWYFWPHMDTKRALRKLILLNDLSSTMILPSYHYSPVLISSTYSLVFFLLLIWVRESIVHYTLLGNICLSIKLCSYLFEILMFHHKHRFQLVSFNCFFKLIIQEVNVFE